jgi:hypothetical protein
VLDQIIQRKFFALSKSDTALLYLFGTHETAEQGMRTEENDVSSVGDEMPKGKCSSFEKLRVRGCSGVGVALDCGKSEHAIIAVGTLVDETVGEAKIVLEVLEIAAIETDNREATFCGALK